MMEETESDDCKLRLRDGLEKESRSTADTRASI